MIRVFYPKIPDAKFKQIVNTIIDSDITAKKNNSFYITTVNKYFIIMIRDGTEYWCQEFEDQILTEFHEERIKCSQFKEIIDAHFTNISDDMAEYRFLECCRAGVNPNMTQLHVSNLSCKIFIHF
jgi:hypothetical protein